MVANRLINLVCWVRGHIWEERPYPPRWPRWRESRKYEQLPYGIDDPLIWNLTYDECARCTGWRWAFRTPAAAETYAAALDGAVLPKMEIRLCRDCVWGPPIVRCAYHEAEYRRTYTRVLRGEDLST
jgi:hypothetical protein